MGAHAPPRMHIDNLRLENDRRLVSALLALSVLPFIWFIGLDLVVHADDWPRIQGPMASRALTLAVPTLGLMAIRRVRTRAAYSRVVLGIALAVAVMLLSLNLQQPYGSALPLRTPLMVLIVMYGALPNSFYRQVAAPLVFSAGNILERLYWLTDSGRGDLASDVAILLFVNLVGVTMVHRRLALEREVSVSWGREHLARDDAERALKELRTLRGIIRICSYCRKIHNEAGAWQQIEAYVRDHSHAEFSHGICPECVTEHFPNQKPAEVTD
jgi:hypothetical protein